MAFLNKHNFVISGPISIFFFLLLGNLMGIPNPIIVLSLKSLLDHKCPISFFLLYFKMVFFYISCPPGRMLMAPRFVWVARLLHNYLCPYIRPSLCQVKGEMWFSQSVINCFCIIFHSYAFWFFSQTLRYLLMLSSLLIKI